ncbi:MAG: DNA polymerase III subunit alpha [Actinomycetaceae bacterium]|nr:DNA polymerase III subunit alpha [Actinomycetaceae bacterium]
MAKDFVHLHVHSEYSMLDGASKLDELVDEAKRIGQSAVAVTDHGYCFGAYEFYKTAKARGVKPIIGVEAYMTPGTSRFGSDRVLWGTEEQRSDDVSARGAYTHMTLLAYNNTGLHNLFRMDSLASIEGQMGKWPRMDRELLERYHEGLIGTAGCPSGEVQTRLRLGQWDEALRAAGEMQEIFGKENYFVELMDHNNAIERRTRNELLELAKKINAPIIATNDSHYTTKEDASVQDAMLCINSGSTLQDPDRFTFDGEGYYLRSAEEMYDLFGDVPGACENTLLIAERCDVSFESDNYMPVFPVPEGETIDSWFVKEVNKGLDFRYKGNVPREVRERADYEVGVIRQMGFPGYFLVVSDYILWAKRNGIRVGPGRGSGAGSMVAYALQITELDPLEHGLLFERFLNPERVSMPDIDVDFDDRRRDEVISYVEEKYGKDHVAQVVTFGTIKTKNALKDAARVLGFPYEMGDRLTKALPPSVQGKDISLKNVFNENDDRYAEASEFREILNNDQDAKSVYDLAKGLEGLTRQWGVHACAVLMSSVPLTDVIPLMKRAKDGAIITQFAYPLCEELGILKMDFLGLSNLTTIEDTLDVIEANGKERPVMEDIPLTDEKTFQLLQSAETLGVFQLDGSGMRTLLKQMKPTEFEDISAVSALYRPGPMGMDSHTNYALRKNGLQDITPIHPELEEPLKEVLGPTYGLIVYQEQVMQIARICAGFTMGQADTLRKAMGKKKMDVLEQQFQSFSDGMLKNGYSRECIDALWEVLVPFAQYAFNKSHSACYGVVSFWTAYLKAHYPLEYMSALLTSNKDKRDKLAIYLAEARRMNITVLVPDVNESSPVFAPVGDSIRFGLSAIHNVGTAVVEGIIQAREEQGAFTSFQDFLSKVPLATLNKKTIEALIMSGAFDSFGVSRSALLACSEQATENAANIKKNEAVGQYDLFSVLGEGGPSQMKVEVDIPDIPEWEKREKLNYERDMLGLYVSDHPLSDYETVLAKLSDRNIMSLVNDENLADGMSVTIAGMITSAEHRVSKKGNPYSRLIVEDLGGSVDVGVFSSVYRRVGQNLTVDSIVQIKARVQRRDDGFSFSAQDVIFPETDHMNSGVLDVAIMERQCTEQNMKKLAEILARYSGSTPVRLHVERQNSVSIVEVGNEYFVHQDGDLMAELRIIFGKDCIKG